MKKIKTVKEFSYLGISKQEMVNLLNSEEPINIRGLEPLIDRIYEKYPIIDKVEISLIVRAVFESIRDFLLLGHIININKFIFDMKLHFFQHVINDRSNTALKVKLKTPPKIKKGLL